MLILLQPDISDAVEAQLVARLRGMGAQLVPTTTFGHRAFCAVGAPKKLDADALAALDGVAEVREIDASFKLASRDFCDTGSVLEIGDVKIGGEEVIIMAGPCAVESEKQAMDAAEFVAKGGARVLRGGAFKPRSSPYSFQGLGEEGLKILRRAADQHGLLVISELIDAQYLDMMVDYVDILQIGARNMQNFALLRALEGVKTPVLLKRGLAATIDEWLMSAEYVMSGGNTEVMVCERGIRSFQKYTRNTLDLAAVPVVRELSHLPIIVDPSHAVGVRDIIGPMACSSVASGADGILIEVHPDPDNALCDGPQSLTPEQFAELADQLRIIASAVGRTMAPAL